MGNAVCVAGTAVEVSGAAATTGAVSLGAVGTTPISCAHTALVPRTATAARASFTVFIVIVFSPFRGLMKFTSSTGA